MSDSIAFFMQGKYVSLDSSRLADAYLVFLDYRSMDETVNCLMADGWTLSDAVLYTRGAAICIANDMEP